MLTIGIGFVIVFYLWTVFSQIPFIQQEIIGQAVFWTSVGADFFPTLFDPGRMDSHQGRFRYLEYLLEAAYWNLMRGGWLPRDLYDCAAIVITLVLTILTLQLAKNKRLPKFALFLIPCFFLLSSQSFMISVWNYRKAKYLATVFIALIALILTLPLARSKQKHWIIGLTTAGVFTDPFFILLIPIISFCHDLKHRTIRFEYTQAVVKGILLGALGVVLLNGVIGPLFNPTCKLLVNSIPDKPKVYLSFSNLIYSFHLLPDFISPVGLYKPIKFFSLFLLLCIAGLFLYSLYRGRLNCPFLCSFILSLPVSAFIVKPVPNVGMYGGYYGHPSYFLFILALMDVFAVLQRRNLRQGMVFAYFSVVFMIITHQMGKDWVFAGWTSHHVQKFSTYQKFLSDYAELRLLRTQIGEYGSANPYLFYMDRPEQAELMFNRVYEMSEPYNGLKRTRFGDVLIPILFQNELRQKSFKIVSGIPGFTHMEIGDALAALYR